MERFIGPVDNPTTVADLNLPTQPLPPTVANGIVPRIEKPAGMSALEIKADVEGSKAPFYVKIRAEGDPGVLANGTGTMYLGFHLDPLYRVHWNNEAGPVEYELKPPPGVTVTPIKGTGPEPEALADADPREFLVNVTADNVDQPLDLDVFYFACDDALTFCIPVNQSYQISLVRDEHHDRTIQTGADNRPITGGGRRRMPNLTSLDADGDGRVSLDEVPQRMRGFFDQMDGNGDGYLAEDELQAGPGAGGSPRRRL